MNRHFRVAITLASFVYRVCTAAHSTAQYGTTNQTSTTANRRTNYIASNILDELHTNDVEIVCPSRDGTILASGSLDGTIAIWDMENGGTLIEILNGSGGSIRSLTFSPDGSHLVSGGGGNDNELIHVYEKNTIDGSYELLGNLLEDFSGHVAVVWTVSFNHDGTKLASGGFNDELNLFIWDMEDMDNLGSRTKIEVHEGSVYSTSFNPDGTKLASASLDTTVIIWSLEDMDNIVETRKVLFGHTDEVNSVVFSPDGTRLASASNDKTIRIWDMENNGGTFLYELTGHTFNVESLSFSPDGTKLASGSFDNTIRIWDAANDYAWLQTLEDHTGWVNSVAFKPNPDPNADVVGFGLGGPTLFSGSSDKTVRIWDYMEPSVSSSEAPSAPSSSLPSREPSQITSKMPTAMPSKDERDIFSGDFIPTTKPSAGPSTVNRTVEPEIVDPESDDPESDDPQTSSASLLQTGAAALRVLCIIAINVFLGLYC